MSLPDSQELRLFSRSRRFGLSGQGSDMVNGQDRGGDKPRQSHDGTNANQDSDDQEIQMVASTFLQK